MICNVCHAEFNEALLSEVAEHQHAPMPPGLSASAGVPVGRKYNGDTQRQSANIAEIRYERVDSTFDVTYLNGYKYRYFDFPQDLFLEAFNSINIGSFLNRKVKGNFRYSRIN